MRRNSRNNWRRKVEEITKDQAKGQNSLWKLSRWSRRTAGEPHVDPHLPPLRWNQEGVGTADNEERTRILAAKFFPEPPTATLRRDAREKQGIPTIEVDARVTEEEVHHLLQGLPNGKAIGPINVPNEALKALSPEIDAGLARAISKAFAEGTLPSSFKESTTIVLRKEGKKDYTLAGSYRPIALENSLAKVVEKALANRITDAAETHNLLPWNQMGARKQRSTLSAIGLLTTCVETAWAAQPGSVVSMLSLDLAGAFDNVPHDTLLEILKSKGLPDWLTKMVACFLHERRTRIAYTGHQSDWIPIRSGIPQGSPLSPILFLLYISELLETFSDPQAGIIGIGFVDDTNLVAWGASAEENCRKLTAAHAQCERWANQHGAQFAPEKYQLIHFTRNRRTDSEDLATSIVIAGHRTRSQATIKLLGVWLDPKLTWKDHITQATRRGQAASQAIGRIATSVWGPSSRHTHQLYTATVRPVILYGAQEWHIRVACEKGTRLKPLENIQNLCLRKATGAYKRTPRIALEKETRTPPLNLYASQIAEQRALDTETHPVERHIEATADTIWRSMRTAGYSPRPGTLREQARARAKGRDSLPREYMIKAWEQRWAGAAGERRTRAPATWSTPLK